MIINKQKNGKILVVTLDSSKDWEECTVITAQQVITVCTGIICSSIHITPRNLDEVK